MQPLHRKHFINTGWAIIGGIILLALGMGVERFREPSRVVLTNRDTTTRLVIAPDSAERLVLEQVLVEMRALRLNGSTQATRRAAPAASPTPASVAAASSLQGAAPVYGAPFIFPSEVEGYLLRGIGSFGSVTCGPSRHQQGADAFVEVNLRIPADTARLSPLFLRISQRSSDGGTTQVFEQLYPLSGRTLVAFPVPRRAGAYEIEAGFYALAELRTEYPPFYRGACALEVL